MTGREVVDRLTTRYMAVGSRMAAREADYVRKANEAIAKANNKNAAATAKILKVEEQLRVARAAARRDTMGLSAEIAAQQRSAEQLTGAFSVTSAALRRVAQLEGDLRKATAKSTDETNKQAKSFNVLRGALTEINSGFELFKKGAAGVRAGIEAVVGKPLDLATGFETGLAKIRTLGVDTASGFEQDLLELARRVPQTAGDITNAAFDAISAQPNKSLDEIVKLLDSASKVATGGSITLQSAVRGLTATTNALKGQNLDAARSADILFATMKQGVFTIDDLVTAQGSSLGVAAALKVSYEEVGATVATLTAGGIPSASEAFTRLDAVMNLLSKPTRLQRKAFEALGIEVGASALQASGFTGKLREIMHATGGSADALSKLTGRNKEAFQAISILLNDGLNKYGDALNEITNDAGAASFAFDQLDDTVAGQLARLSAEFEGLLIQVGKALLPTIREAIADLQAAIASDNGASLVEAAKAIATTLIQVARGAAQAAKALSDLFTKSHVGRALQARAAIEAAAQTMERLREESADAGRDVYGFGAALGSLGDRVANAITEADDLNTGMTALRVSVGDVANLWGPFGLGAAAASGELMKLRTDAVDPGTLALNRFVIEASRTLLALTGMPGASAAAAAGIKATITEIGKLRTLTLTPKKKRSKRGSATVEPLDFALLGSQFAAIASDLGAKVLDPFILTADEAFERGVERFVSGVAINLEQLYAVAFPSMTEGLRAMIEESEAGLAQTMGNIDALTTTLAQGFSAALVDVLVFGASFDAVINQLANAVARQALIQVPLEIGYAIADQAKFLSTGFPQFQAAAAAHLAAAKTFAAIGGGALIAAAATGGISGRGQGAQAGGAGQFGTGTPSRRDFGERPGGAPRREAVSTTIILNSYSPSLMTERDQENAISGALRRAELRRGAPRLRQRRVRARA